MKFTFLKPWHLLASIMILLVSNLWILGRVWWDHHSDPLFELILTNRELYTLGTSYDEDSSRSLNLVINKTFWLDSDDRLQRAKTFEFCSENASNHRKHYPSKVVYTLLELNGPIFAQFMESAEKELLECRQKNVGNKPKDHDYDPCRYAESQVKSSTRLMVADVALEQASLLTQYRGKPNYAMVRGTMIYSGDCQLDDPKRRHYHNLYLNLPRSLHLTKALYENLPPRDMKFTAQLKIGQSLLPRITSID